MTAGELKQKLAEKFDIEYIEKVEVLCRRLGLSYLIGYYLITYLSDKKIIPIDMEPTKIVFLTECYIAYALFYISKLAKNTYASKINKPYNEFIQNFKQLSRELDINTPVELYVLYSYMYNNGYLSVNKRFYFDGIHNLQRNYGSSVLAGNGVCRHIASLFSDILNSKDDITASTIGVYAYDNDEDQGEKSYRGISKDLLLFPIYRIFGNHAISVCIYNDKIYAFDPTNLSNLKLYDKKKRILRGDGLDHKLIHNELICLAFNYKRPCFEVLKAMKEKDFYVYTEDDLENLTKLSERVSTSHEILDKFYEENKELYIAVANQFESPSRCRK